MMRFGKLFTYPEYRYNLYGALDYLLNNRRYRSRLGDPGYLPERSLLAAMEDALEYLQVDAEEFFRLADAWKPMEEELFNRKDSEQEFYESWNEEYARSNICANILSQHQDRINFAVMSGVFGSGEFPRGHFVDLGCGTASLSIALAMEEAAPGPLLLVDVPNQVQDFVRFRLQKRGLGDLSVQEPEAADAGGSAAGIYCIDVLEHLADPSSVLKDQIHPALALSGVLYLKAPWRGQLTHLDEAPENFYRQGGRKFLGSRYRCLYRVEPMDVAAVYRKVAK
jgi:hypothetical protein